MPLDEELRKSIHAYCTRDLPGDLQWHIAQFSFVDDEELKKRLGRAYYSARYIAKLMEALQVAGDEIHPFVKFQIIQYASIYEAVIAYLLWTRYEQHPEVQLLRTHKSFKPVSALGSATAIQFITEDFGTERIFTCVQRNTSTPRNSIAFGDKVDCAVRIGFVKEEYAEEIKDLYRLRNLAHIETEAEKRIEVQLEHAKAGYWRMKPFLETILIALGGNAL